MIEEMLVQILDNLKIFLTNPLFIVPVVFVCVGYLFSWLFFMAKRHQPISKKEVDILWKSHRQFSQCKAKKYEKITRGEKIVGYKCECGYEHKQKRPAMDCIVSIY